MIRTVLLGLFGLVLAVVVGIGVHLLTRDTIALPAVRLEQGRSLAPPAATRSTTTGTTTGTTSGASADTETGDDDGSGRGRGRGRGRGGDD